MAANVGVVRNGTVHRVAPEWWSAADRELIKALLHTDQYDSVTTRDGQFTEMPDDLVHGRLWCREVPAPRLAQALFEAAGSSIYYQPDKNGVLPPTPRAIMCTEDEHAAVRVVLNIL
eukprot:scaffold192341_cov36-Prasinocladus_malaysianus.AAC.1